MKKYFVIKNRGWGALKEGDVVGITTNEEYAKSRVEWATYYEEVKMLDFPDSIKKIRKKKLKKINKNGKEITN